MVNTEEEACVNETEVLHQQMTSNLSTEDAAERGHEKTGLDIKYDWYQSGENIIVSVFEKNFNKENFNINFTDDSVSIRLIDDQNVIKNLQLHLYNFIKPLECSYKVLATKVEVKLKKLLTGFFWFNLEKKVPGDHVKEQINWDKVVKNEMDNDDMHSDMSSFLQKIYTNGSDDQKRAMIKSYYESCGTVLTTDWNEARAKRVAVQTPDGMEWRNG